MPTDNGNHDSTTTDINDETIASVVNEVLPIDNEANENNGVDAGSNGCDEVLSTFTANSNGTIQNSDNVADDDVTMNGTIKIKQPSLMIDELATTSVDDQVIDDGEQHYMIDGKEVKENFDLIDTINIRCL